MLQIFLISAGSVVAFALGYFVRGFVARSRQPESAGLSTEVLESMSDAFFSVDKHWKLTHLNANYERAGGVRREERIGKDFREILRERKLEDSNFWREYHRVMNDRTSVEFEEYYPTQKIWTRCRAYPTPDGGMAVFFSDITAERKAALELERSRERYQIVFENSPIPMWVFDPDTFQILEVNRASVQHYGYSHEEFLKLSAIDLRPPETIETFKAWMKELTEAGSGTLSVRSLHRVKSGETIHVDVTTHDIIIDGKRVRLAAFVDVTDAVSLNAQQKKLFERLEKAKESAEAADRAKTHFLANMSHEIRTPLGAITGFSELLEDSHISSDERAQHIQTIRRNADLLTKVVDEILDITKIEAKTFDVESVPVDLNSLMQEALAPLQLKAMEKGLRLSVPEKAFKSARVLSDPTRLKQVLLNLIGNAIKFTSRGGVSVETSQRIDGTSVYCSLRIRDTGIGISPEQRERLFKPFSQGDSSMSRRYGGTGLGLSISKQIANLLGGDVKLIRSESGEGSEFEFTFVVRLPLGSEVKAKPAAAAENGLLEGISVLVVDDAPDNRELMKRLLSRAGARVDLASHGAEGVSRALSATFDAVLMDIQMPVLDGYEATKRLRDNHYLGPIIALTAHAVKTERDRALSEGFDAYLTKPVNKEELIKTLLGFRT